MLSNGTVLVTGGQNYDEYLDTAELYHPSTGSWTLIDNLNDVRKFHTASVLHNGEVLVTGGITDNEKTLNTAELYYYH